MRIFYTRPEMPNTPKNRSRSVLRDLHVLLWLHSKLPSTAPSSVVA